jgi:DNA-directed RNA polymerase specialized sigma24 family protein
MEAAARKDEKPAERGKSPGPASAAKIAGRKTAAEDSWAERIAERLKAAEGRAAWERDVDALAATEGFDPYNLARGLVAGSPRRLGARGRLGQANLPALELAFWLAAGGLAEPPSPERLTMSPYLRRLLIAVRSGRPARALAAAELARSGAARRTSEAIERHLDSLPGLALAEAEAVPGKVLAFDDPIPGAPASEVFQTLMRVLESFSGLRRVAIGLFHIEGLKFTETSRLLKVYSPNLNAELRHGRERLASAVKAYLTRLAVARGHDLTDFPGLDGLRGGRTILSPVPSRGELPDRPAPETLEPPHGAGAISAVESESATLARRLAILSPDGLGLDYQPAIDLAFWLAAAGLSEPPEEEKPRPRPLFNRLGRRLPAPAIRRPPRDLSEIVAPPASEALGVLTRALERLSDRPRLVLRLLCREGLDLLEAGRRLGISPLNVRAEWGAALKSLSDTLHDYLLAPAGTTGHPAAGHPGLDPSGR